jgi:probable rRNA maturation factor
MAVSLQIQARTADLKKNADELLRFTKRAREAVGLSGTVGVMVDSSERMRAMNRYFRHKDEATDVLSFPASSEMQHRHAGDIAISADIAATNASALGHSTSEEIKILILHGMLHLAGYDHETDSGSMARIERRLRRQLGLAGSLTERSSGASEKKVSSRKTARIKMRKSPVQRAGRGVRRKKSTK